MATVPGFGAATQAMLQATVALGGTDLYLQKRSADWLLVRGIAYRCDPGPVAGCGGGSGRRVSSTAKRLLTGTTEAWRSSRVGPSDSHCSNWTAG